MAAAARMDMPAVISAAAAAEVEAAGQWQQYPFGDLLALLVEPALQMLAAAAADYLVLAQTDQEVMAGLVD
jgi:hypothetical protein